MTCKTIGLVSLKGGVGKTTLSCALAADLAYRHGRKVLLVDANYSAPNLGIHMDIISPKKTIHDVLSGGRIKDAIHKRYGVDVVPGNFLFKRGYSELKLKNKLAHVKKNYDFIILDGSPSLNQEVFSTMIAADDLFIVSTPDYPTLSCSMKTAKFARQKNAAVSGIILNRCKGKYDVGLQEIQESTGIPVVVKIKEDKIVNLALHERVPATLFAGNSKFSKEIRKFSDSLVGKRERRSFAHLLFGKNMKRESVNRELMRQSFYKSMFE